MNKLDENLLQTIFGMTSDTNKRRLKQVSKKIGNVPTVKQTREENLTRLAVKLRKEIPKRANKAKNDIGEITWRTFQPKGNKESERMIQKSYQKIHKNMESIVNNAIMLNIITNYSDNSTINPMINNLVENLETLEKRYKKWKKRKEKTYNNTVKGTKKSTQKSNKRYQNN